MQPVLGLPQSQAWTGPGDLEAPNPTSITAYLLRIAQTMSRSADAMAVLALTIFAGTARLAPQSAEAPSYHVNVNLVTLSFSVTDAKGNAVRGLKATDIRIFEDGIPEKISSFAEGSQTLASGISDIPLSAGTNIFILFDTSNRMYRSLPYVCDSIADFIRSLNPADSIGIYTFSRNLIRTAPLTNDHAAARAELAENVSAGDDTALFNGVLLTLRDAARVAGRKAIVVFSDGPDNASMVSPDDVGRVARDEGIPVYVVSTLNESGESPTAHALERLTQVSGGKLYLARNWQAQARAFTSIHEDINSSYTVWYYPAPNSNEGFRSVTIQVVSPEGKIYDIRSRAGYESKKSFSPPAN